MAKFKELQNLSKKDINKKIEDLKLEIIKAKVTANKGGKVKLMAIDEPLSNFKNPMDMFQKTLKHEQFITKCINELVDLSINEKDHATQIFLQWFVTEQIEEEGNDNDIISKLELAGSKGNGLFLIDKELSTRVYNPPVKEKN